MDEEDFENVSDEKETATETGLRYSILALYVVLQETAFSGSTVMAFFALNDFSPSGCHLHH